MMWRFGCGLAAKLRYPVQNGFRGVILSIKEHSMRPVMRTVALFLLLVGAGTGQSAAQANPQPQDNPQGGPPPPNYPPPQGNPPPNNLRPRPAPIPRASTIPQTRSSTRVTGSSAPSRAGSRRSSKRPAANGGCPTAMSWGRRPAAPLLPDCGMARASSTPRMPATFGSTGRVLRWVSTSAAKAPAR